MYRGGEEGQPGLVEDHTLTYFLDPSLRPDSGTETAISSMTVTRVSVMMTLT